MPLGTSPEATSMSSSSTSPSPTSAANNDIGTATDGDGRNDQQQRQLLPSLHRAFPSVSSYQILDTIVQANAVGYKVQLEYDHENDNDAGRKLPKYAFVKQVIANRYVRTKKDWTDLRRTLLYARTEGRWYRDFAPRLSRCSSYLPAVYSADYNLDGWIDESENATATAASANPPAVMVNKEELPHNKPEEQEKGLLLILECIDTTAATTIATGGQGSQPATTTTPSYFQDSPLTLRQSKQCLDAAAQLHASAWQNVSLLQKAQKELSKASFHLQTRNPKELDQMVNSWESFGHHFRKDLEKAGLWQKESVRLLGKRVQSMAHYISDELSPTPNGPYATIIHGDYKAMNVFLPANNNNNAILVDFASVGIGLGVSDVAMHIHHAIRPEDLEKDNGEYELFRYYWESLQDALRSNNKATDSSSNDYPYDVAVRHYRFAVVDYFRFVLGRFWKTATLESMKAKENSKNTVLVNRSVPAACAFVRRVDQYLGDIEAEWKRKQQRQ